MDVDEFSDNARTLMLAAATDQVLSESPDLPIDLLLKAVRQCRVEVGDASLPELIAALRQRVRAYD